MKTRFLSGLLGTAATVTSIISGTAVEVKALTTDFDPISLPSVMRNADNTYTPLLNEIRNSFVQDERAFLNESNFFELDASTLTFVEDTEPVEIYFIDEGAGFTTNDLLVSISGGSQQTVFGDISCSVDCKLPEAEGMYRPGDGVSLGFRPAGTTLDLTLSTVNGSLNYTASAEANPDGLQHIVAFEFEFGGEDWVIVGFEDLPGPLGGEGNSDRDFNDVVFAIRGVVADPADVPEPSTMVALFSVGAFGLFGLRRHKK